MTIKSVAWRPQIGQGLTGMRTRLEVYDISFNFHIMRLPVEPVLSTFWETGNRDQHDIASLCSTDSPSQISKGKFPQTTMWIEWVESKFRNPIVKVWADLDNPFNRSDYAKLFMSPSLDGTLPEYVTSQEDNSPLTLYIDFHNFSWISVVLLIKFTHKCMHIHLSPEEGRYIFMKSKILYNFVYNSIRQLYCCDITDIRRVPPERATYTKLMKPLKNNISWLDYPNLPKLLLLGF